VHDVLALEPWIDILEAALPADQNGLLVRLAWPDDDCSGGDVELGLLPLDGVHPAELLDGFDAPDEWWALGLVTRGWASPMGPTRPSQHPGRRRVTTTVLLDRAGRLVGRTVGDDGTVWIDGPPSEGELIRLLRQAMEGGSMP